MLFSVISVVRDLRDGVLVVHVEDLLLHLELRLAHERLSLLVGLALLQQFRLDLFVDALTRGVIVGDVAGRPDLFGRFEVLLCSVAHRHALVEYVLFEERDRILVNISVCVPSRLLSLKNMLAGRIRSTHLLQYSS